MDTGEILFRIVFVACFCGLIFWLISGSEHNADQEAKLAAWSYKCAADGGIKTITEIRENLLSTSYDYECIKDGKIIDHED